MFLHWQRIAPWIAIAASCALVAAMAPPPAQQDSTAQDSQETSLLQQKPSELPEGGPDLPPPSNVRAPRNIRQVVPAQKLAPAQPRRPFLRAVPATAEDRAASVENRSPVEIRENRAEEPLPMTGEPTGLRVVEEVAIRPTPPIDYDADGDARRLYRAHGEVDLIMVTENPADGCFYEIPLCIPACCTDQPIVRSRRGIFGRGIVEYCWACGFSAEVKFRHLRGDVEVEYEGD